MSGTNVTDIFIRMHDVASSGYLHIVRQQCCTAEFKVACSDAVGSTYRSACSTWAIRIEPDRKRWIVQDSKPRTTSRRCFCFSSANMTSAETSCYTVVTEDNVETPSTSDLRSALQKGSDEVKLDTLRKIIVSTINGNPEVI